MISSPLCVVVYVHSCMHAHIAQDEIILTIFTHLTHPPHSRSLLTTSHTLLTLNPYSCMYMFIFSLIHRPSYYPHLYVIYKHTTLGQCAYISTKVSGHFFPPCILYVNKKLIDIGLLIEWNLHIQIKWSPPYTERFVVEGKHRRPSC